MATNTAELSPAVREAVEQVVKGWYPAGTRVDWDDFVDRVEDLSDENLGADRLSPLVKAVKAYAWTLRQAY